MLGVPVKMLDAQNNRLWFRCESISKSQIEVNGNEFFGKTTYPSKLLLLYGLYRTISFVGQLKMKWMNNLENDEEDEVQAEDIGWGRRFWQYNVVNFLHMEYN